MIQETSGQKTSSFWTTLPGILTALAALITAFGTFWVTVLRQPPSPPQSAEPEVAIVDLAQKAVPEEAKYTIRDGAQTFILVIHEIKGKKREIVVSAAAIGTSSPATRYSVQEGDQVIIPVNSRDYTFAVHKITDRKDNQDQAVISMRPK